MRTPMKNERYPLRIIMWETTLRCNANCKFCGSRCGFQQFEDEIDADTVIAAFTDIAERYDASKIMVNVTGGEPLMRADTISIMKIVKSMGFHWGLVTNGTLLTKQTVDALKNAGMSTVSVSIDGLSSTHNSLRGMKDGFERVINGIELLAEQNFVDSIMATTVVTNENIDELDKLKQFLTTIPIDTWRICPVDAIGKAYDDKSVLLSPVQFVEALDFIEYARRENLPFKVTTSCSHYLGAYEFRLRDYPFSCQSGKTICSILANGDIYVCPNVERVPSLIQGNIKKDKLSDVWKNGFAYFRNNMRCETGKCKNCSRYSNCAGDSLHTWDFKSNIPKVCAVDLGLTDILENAEIRVRSYRDYIREIQQHSGSSLLVTAHAQSMAKDKVIVLPQTAKMLFEYFEWGTTKKTKEKICALYGNIFNCSETINSYFASVSTMLPIEQVDSSITELKINADMIRTAFKNADPLSGRTLLGFAHSHPNQLTIAMSLGDYAFHRSLYNMDWRSAMTLIINPQKKHFAAYTGSNADHIEASFLVPKDKWEI